VAGEDGEEGGVVLRDPHGDGVAGDPDQEPGEPQAKSQADGGGERAVEEAKARGAPAIRIGSVSARCRGTS
jgi:hypothetical protein